MKYQGRILTLAAGIAATVALVAAQAPAPADPVLQAMRDEIARAKTLSIPNLDAPPYFVQYTIDQEENFSVSATLGGLVTRSRQQIRSPDVRIRVGSYKFDNTNFAGAGFGGGSRYDLERFPTENVYPLLRRYLWLETDSAYKAAVEALSRKRAAQHNTTQSEQLDDFDPAPAVHYLRDIPKLTIDEDAWSKRVRDLSAVFQAYPELKTSGVSLESSAGGAYVANSEGTEIRYPEVVTNLHAEVWAQAPDGMNIRDAVDFRALHLSQMPSDAEMTRAMNTLATNVVALAHAPKGDDYTGPILFEGQAGPQIFAEVLGRNLTITRRPVTDGGRGGNIPPGEFEGKSGARIMPDSFTVVDDPTQKEWRGRPLFGSYDVDREGVAAVPLTLVDKGVLKNYLLTRQPVKGYNASNGRARLPGSFGANEPTMSNLFVSTSDKTPVADLKKKLIDLCAQRNKPYGIIVRKMDFPSFAPLDEARRIVQSAGGSGHFVSVPLLAYKVFPDGHEELIRGVRFRGFTGKSLRDILAAGDDSVTLEYMENGAPMGLSGRGFTAEVSVVAPSVIIDDLELHSVEEEMPKLPVVPPPDMTKH
ncbi:MAG TPA: metallopeptidase TldD-related protein [Bryobacteraceae bacterium]|nr:metallopeptidase TldD-related protein [Bryobacteraceae bacterium]